MSDHGLLAALNVTLAVLIGAVVVWFAGRRLGRNRPGLNLGVALLAAFGVRILVAAVLSDNSLGHSIRGIDEIGFLADARALARLSLSSHQWLRALTGHLTIAGVYNAGTLHIFTMALQLHFFRAPGLALRATMATISVVGLGLIAAAAYELGGSRAARLTVWVLSFEPANVFFSTALHKEPLLYLADGMIALGAALSWQRPRVVPVGLMAAGCLVATATATYVGWFLAAGCALVLLHVAVRGLPKRSRWAVGLATVTIITGTVAIPSVAQRTQTELAGLQTSQNRNAQLHSKLGLERVNLSTPGEIAVNLPRRMFDLMFRPYPWQVADTSQRLGVIETLFVLALLAFLAQRVATRRQRVLAAGGALVYPTVLLWIAYSLAVANAGTGFRYRTQIIPLMIVIAVVPGTQSRYWCRRPSSAGRRDDAPLPDA